MTKTNLLFVSISFPPKNDPECLQTARYFHYLQKSGLFSITVVTSKIPTLFMPEDDSLRKYTQGIDHLIEIPLVENKFLSFVLRKLGLGFLLFPDSKMTFHWRVKRAINKIKSKPDLIYSRSNPMSSAFMAKKLKEHFKCPWIMHCSDPWAISPLHDHFSPQNLKGEEALLRAATLVSFTTEQTLSLYKSHYPWVSSRLTVFPNVYDPQDITEVAPPASQKLKIVYTGGLAGKRSVFFLEHVLEKLKEALPDGDQKIEFVFAGDMDRANKGFFKKGMPGISHVGLLSHSKAKELCQSAHMLLIVDNPTTSEGAVFFPSKLLDYFLTKRKIWAVSPADSTTRSVLEGYTHEAFEHSDIKGMADFLLKSIRQFENGETHAFLSNHLPEQYRADRNAEVLGKLLASLKVK